MLWNRIGFYAIKNPPAQNNGTEGIRVATQIAGKITGHSKVL